MKRIFIFVLYNFIFDCCCNNIMKIPSVKNAFIKPEPDIPEYELEELFSGPHIKKIYIKLKLDNDNPYPFSVSPAFVEYSINKLKSIFPLAEIVCTTDHEQRNLNVLMKDFPSSIVVVPKEEIKFNDNSLFHESDLRIALSTVQIHYHHLLRQYFGATADLKIFGFQENYDSIYSILDCRSVAITNEHLFFNTSKFYGKVITGWNTELVDKKATLILSDVILM
jgi:hypothetical protein